MIREEITKKYSPELENLLLILTEFQNHNKENYIRDEDMAWIAEYLNITMSAVYGVVTYYSMFSTVPRGRFVIRVCRSPVCSMMGSDTVVTNLESHLRTQEGLVSKDGLFSYEQVECLGQCDKAPSMMVNDEVYGHVTLQEIEKIISSLQKKI